VVALATCVGISGAALGLRLTGARKRASAAVPFTAGVLIGVALFGLLPEMGSELGWAVSLLLFAAGYGVLELMGRLGHPVCPSCSHDHDHDSCAAELHGFAWPLITAAALHSFLDGWSIATVQVAATLGLRVAAPLAVALHKAPEGIALGGILRASVRSRRAAFAWCVLAEGMTLAGGGLGLLIAPRLGTGWTTYPLGVTAGWLFYLGYHAVHEEWIRHGAGSALRAAVAGVVFAAIIQRGAEALLR
jgi:zinc transporter ZupT